ncbi:MAG: DUF4440 domain-containing protein [Planctomycetota bacterium]|nr:DUF4440 domain-containing protein [Planctomycetota bacterium]
MLLFNETDAMPAIFMIALVVVAVVLIRLWAGSLDGDRIERHVQERGGRVVHKTWTPFGPGWLGEQSARIYRVVYEDRDGNRREASVKTSMMSGVYMLDEDDGGERRALSSAPSGALAEQLQALELRLLEPGVRASSEALEGLLAEDFREFGASGQSFDRAGVVAVAAGGVAEPAERYQLEDFEAHAMGEDHALVTYLLRVLGPDGAELRSSRRSSHWRREPGGWRLVFHQGTPAEASE